MFSSRNRIFIPRNRIFWNSRQPACSTPSRFTARWAVVGGRDSLPVPASWPVNQSRFGILQSHGAVAHSKGSAVFSHQPRGAWFFWLNRCECYLCAFLFICKDPHRLNVRQADPLVIIHRRCFH